MFSAQELASEEAVVSSELLRQQVENEFRKCLSTATILFLGQADFTHRVIAVRIIVVRDKAHASSRQTRSSPDPVENRALDIMPAPPTPRIMTTPGSTSGKEFSHIDRPDRESTVTWTFGTPAEGTQRLKADDHRRVLRAPHKLRSGFPAGPFSLSAVYQTADGGCRALHPGPCRT